MKYIVYLANKVHKVRKIGQYTKDNELVKIWNTVRECKKEFPNVSKVLNGTAKHCHNYLFKYIEQVKDMVCSFTKIKVTN